MALRSRISPRFLVNQLATALSDDWATSYALMKYQMAKESFNLRHPFGVQHGRGDGVELVSLRITDMCNLRCHSCGQWGDNGYLLGESLKTLKQREVPVEIYKGLVDQILDAGWSPIWYIWGGEPMLYPGLIELLHYIKERGMPISLVSNSTNIARRADDILETCKILYLSVDGSNEEIHNTQRPGVTKNYDSFKDVKAALETIHEGKKQRNLAFPYVVPLSCVTMYNIDDVVDLYKFTSQYADAQIFYLTWWMDSKSAQEHTEDFERRFGFKPQTHYGWIGTWKDFDHGVILEKFEEMNKISKAQRRCPPIMMPNLNTREEINQYYTDHSETFGYNQCVSIHMTLEIDSNGDVSLCRDYHDYVIGNIKTDAITDIWNNDAARKFRSSISTEGIMPVCRRCCGLMGF
ncbi:radical SAM protein [Candidatus Poribacteria bacterium]|nr:radical SAM protein [Candidatus Poribacteria bacterium]